MIRSDWPITNTKKQGSLIEFTLLEIGHTYSYMLLVACLLLSHLLTVFSEIFIAAMLCDRQVCSPCAGELKFSSQWIRLIVSSAKARFMLLLRREGGICGWGKQGAGCQLGCSIQLHVKWFVILSNHLGQALAPFYLYMTLGQSQYS